MSIFKKRPREGTSGLVQKLAKPVVNSLIKSGATIKKSGGFFSDLWTGVKNFAGEIVDTGKKIIGTVTGSAKDVTETFRNIGTNLSKGVGEGVGGLGKGVGGLAEGIGKNLPFLAIGGAILGFAFLKNK